MCFEAMKLLNLMHFTIMIVAIQ